MSQPIEMNLQLFTENGAPETNQEAGKLNDQKTEEIKTKEVKTEESEKKTFTQAEVNTMMTKEKNQGRAAVLRELGVEDVKNTKDALKKYQEYLESQKTEVEKLKYETDVEKSARLALEKKTFALENKLEAIKQGAKTEYVEDVVALANIKASEDVSLEDVLKEMKTKYPQFFNIKEDGNQGGTGSSVGSKSFKTKAEGAGKRLAEKYKQPEIKSSYFKN